jgi:hypothetical protein
MATKNPYASSDGSPLPDKWAEFLQWGDEQRQRQLDALPAGEREVAMSRQRRLDDRIASEVGVSLV